MATVVDVRGESVVAVASDDDEPRGDCFPLNIRKLVKHATFRSQLERTCARNVDVGVRAPLEALVVDVDTLVDESESDAVAAAG